MSRVKHTRQNPTIIASLGLLLLAAAAATFLLVARDGEPLRALMARIDEAFARFLPAPSGGCSRPVRAEGDIQSICTQLMIYEQMNGSMPTSSQGLQVLVCKPATEPIPRKWRQLVSVLPQDPWGNNYLFETPARRSKASFDLYSKGPDRVAGTGDDIGNW